ncbi:MAG: hypothetical protein HYZ44_00135 [Bacteroidetes bacterium]|nr:hypothetical protein [Bacteroidota bacterium]
MKKQNDSGYPVNVRNFKTLIDVIISFGAAYNPVKFSIKLENLKAMFDKIMLSLKAVDAAARDMSSAQKMRQRVFYELEAFVTRIVGAVGSCDIIPEKVEKFGAMVNKFRAKRATPQPSVPESPDAPGVPAARTNSTTQASFTRKQDNFSELVTFLEGEPNYQTNELDLKLEALQAMASELEARNDAVSSTEAAYSSALISRDKLFFAASGLVPCTKAVKSYVKSAFKASSPEFKKVSGIPFTNKKNKQ